MVNLAGVGTRKLKLGFMAIMTLIIPYKFFDQISRSHFC